MRAVLEAMAYQTYDILKIMEQESGVDIVSLKVDGGASNNNFLMQFQSDVLGVDVLRPECERQPHWEPLIWRALP